MPTYKLYDIEITNQYTNEAAKYNGVLCLAECAETINNHFGCSMITKNDITNMMIRGVSGSPERFSGIRISSRGRSVFNKMLFGDVTLGYLSCWGKLPANAVCLSACLPVYLWEWENQSK